MGKLNRRKHQYREVPAKSESSPTADILQTIRAVIRSTWNRRYDLKYEDHEAREMYIELRRYCKKHYGKKDRQTLLKVLADMREWLIDHPNSSLAHVFLFYAEENKFGKSMK